MTRDVLIVDDSLTVRMDLREAFDAAGFEPVLCADLACARAALAERSYALFILDVLLPDGDGVEFLGELRLDPVHGATPVIMLSSEAEVRHRIRGLRTGADDYVGKPYDTSYLIARAHDLVRRAAPTAHAPARGPVLIVDDSITAREELRASVEAAGHDVVTAASGEEGLRVAADRRPAAVLVDGVMPGIDGATFVRQLRSDPVLRTTPCILLTASSPGGELRALEAGADAYVRKEEGHDVVIARLNALLRSSSPPGVVGTTGLLTPKRILVVGAGDPLPALVERLRQDGHEIVVATVTDALALLSVDRSVDGVLVDATLDFAAALETCCAIKRDALWREIPMLLIGVGSEHDRMVEAVNAGADDYVTLASGLEVVRARVRAQLRRKQFEDENRTRDAFARSAAILETISDAFCAVDRQWRFVYVNHALEALLGAKREKLEGELMWDWCTWLREEDRRMLRRAAEERLAVTFEAEAIDERWFEVRAFPHGQGLSAYVRDVTERHRSQEVQAHLLGIVGHDLRTPLAVISTSTEIVLRDPGLTEKQRLAMHRAAGSVARMTRLIADLLDYSRARLGEGLRIAPRRMDLDRVCRDVIDEVKASHPNRTVVYRSGGPVEGEWDPDRIQQVLVNLLTNALRYSPPDSDVELALARRERDVLVSVHNAGRPIPRELREHIFEPFRRGEDRGSWGGVGLGLYIVKQIVAAHGGTVSLESEEGAGTTFTVALLQRQLPSHM